MNARGLVDNSLKFRHATKADVAAGRTISPIEYWTTATGYGSRGEGEGDYIQRWEIQLVMALLRGVVTNPDATSGERYEASVELVDINEMLDSDGLPCKELVKLGDIIPDE